MIARHYTCMTPAQRKHAKLLKEIRTLEQSYGIGSLLGTAGVQPDKVRQKNMKLVLSALNAGIDVHGDVMDDLFPEEPNPTVA